MIAALRQQTQIGKIIPIADVPRESINELEFAHLGLLSAGDYVWVRKDDSYISCQIQLSKRVSQRAPLELVSYQVKYTYLGGSHLRTITMGDQTELFHIDEFFLYNYSERRTTPHQPAMVFPIRAGRGGA